MRKFIAITNHITQLERLRARDDEALAVERFRSCYRQVLAVCPEIKGDMKIHVSVGDSDADDCYTCQRGRPCVVHP